jgi:hypothetical protein
MCPFIHIAHMKEELRKLCWEEETFKKKNQTNEMESF